MMYSRITRVLMMVVLIGGSIFQLNAASEMDVKGTISLEDTTVSATDPVELSHDDGGAFGLKIKTQGGELDIGFANTWPTCHYVTDQGGVHWFNNQLEIQTGILRAYSTSNISLKTNGTTHLFIKNSTGEVGIGNEDPKATLDVSGNVQIANELSFLEVSSVPSNVPSKARIYAVDIDSNFGDPSTSDGAGATTLELRAMDGAGNKTTISPHNFKMYEPAADDVLPWSYRSHNNLIGKEVNVDMSGAIRTLEMLSGKQFIFTEDLPEEQKKSPQQWRQQCIENCIQKEKEKLLAKDPAVEIAMADAWEEVNEMIPTTVIKYRMNWDTMELEGYQDADHSNMQPTGKILRQFKAGVTLDENTGKFYRKRILDEIELPVEMLEKINKIKLPKYIRDRIAK